MSKRVIAVKGVPYDLYKQIKEKAIEMGIPVGKAVSDALKLWLGIVANKQYEDEKKEVLKILERIMSSQWRQSKSKVFFKLYRKLLNENRRCFIATDVFTLCFLKRNYNTAVLLRDFISSKNDFIVSVYSLVKLIEELGQDMARKVILSLPSDKIASLDWKVLIKSLEYLSREELSLEHAIIVAQMEFYNINTIISSDKRYDEYGIIRVDPLI